MTRADDARPFLSVAIPAFDEEDRIGPTLHRILAYLSRQSYSGEVVVAVDGSTDRTADIVGRVAAEDTRVRMLLSAANRGKGHSVRRAVLESRGRFVLISDADLSTPIDQVERLLPRLQAEFDVAIASRALNESAREVQQPLGRRVSGRIFNALVRGLALSEFRDTQCGFKCFTRDAAQRVFSLQRIDRFAFDVEVLWIARRRLGLRVVDVPVVWVHDADSKVNLLRDGSRMLFDLVRIRWNDWRGFYGDDGPA